MAVFDGVAGQVAGSDLGVTLLHEHLYVNFSEYDPTPERMLVYPEEAISDLILAKEHGLKTVIDISPRGFGREMASLAAIARTSGIQVLVSTGYYREGFFPQEVYDSTVSELANSFIHDIRRGIGPQGVRACIIGEIGTGPQAISASEKKVILAAAAAHLETGVPVYTHCTLGRLGGKQLDLLVGAGMSPERVVIGHQDLCPDHDKVLRLADQGANIGIDSVGKEHYQPDDVRVRLIDQLIRMGHASRIVLSLDLSKRNYYRCNGGYGYAHLWTRFCHLLAEAGIDESLQSQMLVDNPRRILNPKI